MANFIPCGEPRRCAEFVQDLAVAAFETPLRRVGKIVYWEIFEDIVKAAVRTAPKGPGGRRRLHPRRMCKVLVRPRLDGLAAAATGCQITERKSFGACLGLPPGDAVPGGPTSSDCRQARLAAKAIKGLFGTFREHWQKEHGRALATQGVRVDAGSADPCAAIAAALAAQNIEPQINEQGTRGPPLTAAQKARATHPGPVRGWSMAARTCAAASKRSTQDASAWRAIWPA